MRAGRSLTAWGAQMKSTVPMGLSWERLTSSKEVFGTHKPFNAREVVRGRLSESALYPPRPCLGAVMGHDTPSMR